MNLQGITPVVAVSGQQERCCYLLKGGHNAEGRGKNADVKSYPDCKNNPEASPKQSPTAISVAMFLLGASKSL